MKKRIWYAVPITLITIGFIFHQFSCNRTEDSLFGSSSQSPLRGDSEANKAGELQDTFRKVYDLYKDKVVFITTEQFVRVQQHPFFDDPFMREFFGYRNEGQRVERRKGLGTGFVLSADGFICTNHHVVAGVDRVTVKINESQYQAIVIGSDEKTDIALLKVDTRQKLMPVFFGDSDKVRVGDWAIAIGNPFGLDRTFTVGVISAIGRRDVDMMGSSHIQTDASINPGNSGGPLINIYGEVVGINRMIYSQSGGYMGIGFAIPINTARSILEQLKKHKKIMRGYIGVSIAQITDEYAKELGLPSNEGAFIGEVLNGGPAERAGIRVGDVVIKINDQKIKDYKDLMQIVGQTPIGKTIKVTVWRKREQINFFINVAVRPE
jgi:Do/DeqQ family serine protease